MSNDKILDNEIYVNDEGGRVEIDEKINRMLDLYFRKPIKSEEYDEENPKQKKNNGEHLYINYVDFEDYRKILDDVDFTNNGGKYKNSHEFIKEAQIYPGEYYVPSSPISKESNNAFLCFSIFAVILALIFLLLNIYTFLFFYFIAIIIQFVYVGKKEFIGLKQLNETNLKKLEKILNSKPCLELFYDKKCIINIPFHSYADISGINLIKKEKCENIVFEKFNLDDKIIFKFPIKFLYFVDSTQQYFKFLILQFNKYCYYRNGGFFDYYKKVYLKFSLKTQDNEIIYKNDSMFSSNFTSSNTTKLNIISIISIFTLLSPIVIPILDRLYKRKIIDFKKTVSIKHDLEKYLNLDTLFPQFIKSNKKIKREKHQVISDRETIQKDFKNICIDLNEKIVKILENNYQNSHNPDIDMEIEGYLVPFQASTGFVDFYETLMNFEFYSYYGTKADKILNKKEDDIFRNPVIEAQPFGNNILKDNIKDFKDNNRNNTHKNENNINFKQIIYTEKTLTLICELKKNSVIVNYTIKLPSGTNNNKTGKFTLQRETGGYERLLEKENPQWTKSEIYIPGCTEPIVIIRKKRAIKLSAGNFEIISDTKINEDLHSGTGSWLDGNDWDNRTINKFVQDCNRISTTNRFKTQ